jgi:hypothetical protein
MVDLQKIVSELRKERDRLNQAIAALEGIDVVSTATRKSATPTLVIKKARKRGRLTPEGRKKLSEMMKKRWAVRRRKGTNGRKAA